LKDSQEREDCSSERAAYGIGGESSRGGIEVGVDWEKKG